MFKNIKMTKQQFEFIAEIVSGLVDLGYCGDQKGIHEADLRTAACRFADELEETNPNFNRERFLEACRPKSEYIPNEELLSIGDDMDESIYVSDDMEGK